MIAKKSAHLTLPLLALGWLVGCDRPASPPLTESGVETSPAHTAAAPEPARDRDLSSGKLPVWNLSESDSKSLGSPYKMSHFEIRPPATFRFIQHTPNPRQPEVSYWVGPIREDETYPQFVVILARLSDRQSAAPLADLFAEVLRGVQEGRKDWSATPAENGTIDGHPFVRCSWTGSAKPGAREGLSDRMMHGIVYMTVQENQAVQIMCQDVAPDHAEWLKQGALAAMSFRLMPPEKTTPQTKP